MTIVLEWQNHQIEINRSKRKSIALHVNEGKIEVRAPKHVSHGFVLQFLSEREHWLNKTLQRHADMEKDRIDYSRAARIPFMGIDIPLIRNTGEKNHWALIEKGLQITLMDPEDGHGFLETLESFYKAQARFWLTKKTEQIAEQAGLNQRLKDIRLRKTKTKWGHCTSQGRIQYNWQIMMAPETVIDYLVCHEVSHLQYMDHSEDFWKLVKSLHEPVDQDRLWLHNNGHRLQLR